MKTLRKRIIDKFYLKKNTRRNMDLRNVLSELGGEHCHLESNVF